MANNQNSPVNEDRMRKIFEAFENAEESCDIIKLQKDSTIKAALYVRELLEDPYTPAKIKIALNIAMKTIEMEFK